MLKSEQYTISLHTALAEEENLRAVEGYVNQFGRAYKGVSRGRVVKCLTARCDERRNGKGGMSTAMNLYAVLKKGVSVGAVGGYKSTQEDV